MPARPRSGWTGDWPRKRRQVTSWKLTAYAPKPVIHAALLAHDEVWDWDPDLVISGSRSRRIGLTTGFWRLVSGKPGKTQKRAVASLFAGKAPKIRIEKLPDADWLVLSQQEVEPIRAGRFWSEPRIPPSRR